MIDFVTINKVQTATFSLQLTGCEWLASFAWSYLWSYL